MRGGKKKSFGRCSIGSRVRWNYYFATFGEGESIVGYTRPNIYLSLLYIYIYVAHGNSFVESKSRSMINL